MRKANVPCDIDWHWALNAIQKILRNCSEDDKLRFTPMDVTRLKAAALEVQEFINERISSLDRGTETAV